MASFEYSRDLCRELTDRLRALPLRKRMELGRYEDGDRLDLVITTAWPEVEGRAVFQIEKFVGGGFAGQVYRSRLESLDLPEGAPRELVLGERYAVKILEPPSRFSVWFRNLVYWLAFQGPFTAQVNRSACRAGLLWPKLLREVAERKLGDREAIADTYASFHDDRIGAWGEVREWVEGRTWRLEADGRLSARRAWRGIDAAETGSPEYVAKHQFMVRLVEMLHAMGAAELARQYEWWTLKSQPNALKRFGHGEGPGDGLCAVDFRAGLALIPILPMSPADIGLIFKGMARGSLAQFDRCDWTRFDAFVAENEDMLSGSTAMIQALKQYDAEYRAAMPDITHQGVSLLLKPALRQSVRHGLVDGYVAAGMVDAAHAERLKAGGWRFPCFYLLGALPGLGRLLRKLWCNHAWRSHVVGMLTDARYLRTAGEARAIGAAIKWHRARRITEAHARRISASPPLYWLEQLTVGWIPCRALHRVAADPASPWRGIRSGWAYLHRFLKDPAFRHEWLLGEINDGYAEGMLDADERDRLLAQIDDPFIALYLRSVGAHLATLPVTQIVSVLHGSINALLIMAAGGGWQAASTRFVIILGIYQVIPISPGSLCRGFYVVYMMVKGRNWRDYVVAAPLSFLKYLGYLSFPLQMTATYPELAQLMAGRWASGAIHVIPVFGEKGALLEHFVFDLFFNVSRAFGHWASRHTRWILNIWMVLSALIALLVLQHAVATVTVAEELRKEVVNVVLLLIGAGLLPRLLMYPVLHGERSKPDSLGQHDEASA
jgi:hypothetical protein